MPQYNGEFTAKEGRAVMKYTVKLGYSNIGFCDTLSIASNRYSFITTLFLGPFDDVITKFYCIFLKGNSDKEIYDDMSVTLGDKRSSYSQSRTGSLGLKKDI
jgi:hypothetical protein